MATRTRKDLLQSLKKDQVEPIYFLFGAEDFLRDEAANEIANAALTGTLLREFNDSTFSLRTGDARDAIAAAEQLPMMSQRRVVRIRDLGKLNETEEEILLDYLARPVETSVVIFNSDDIDKRKKLAKRLMSGAAFEFAPLTNAELSNWAKSYLHELKAEASQPVLGRIVELVGPNVRMRSPVINRRARLSDTSSVGISCQRY